jgi:hypothetical protein
MHFVSSPRSGTTSLFVSLIGAAAAGAQATGLMVALQIGRLAVNVRDTKSLGGVTTNVPMRGHESPVVVSIA